MNESMRILLAEVDTGIAMHLKNYLNSFGHKVFPVVTSGEDLMEQVKLLNPSLIITDIDLNGQMDGIEAIARLRCKDEVPYIFITANDDYSSLISSYNLNPVCLIKKPIDQLDLYASIEKAQLQPELVQISHSAIISQTHNYFYDSKRTTDFQPDFLFQHI